MRTVGQAHSDDPRRAAVRPPKIAELIANDIRTSIVLGGYSNGDSLPSEANLLDQYGVSRPTLREAYRILEAEGLLLVRRGAHGGPEVRMPDISAAARTFSVLLQLKHTTILDVLRANEAIEPYCVRLLAAKFSAEDRVILQEAINEIEQLVRTGKKDRADVGVWTRSTRRFGQLIRERCGNQTLELQGALLGEVMDTHLAITLAQHIRDDITWEHYDLLLKSERKLLRLLEGRDPDAAEQHWRSHLSRVTRILSGRRRGEVPIVKLFK